MFDSSTDFVLRDHRAPRSPDVAWEALARWQAQRPEEGEPFVPLRPREVVAGGMAILERARTSKIVRLMLSDPKDGKDIGALFRITARVNEIAPGLG